LVPCLCVFTSPVAAFSLTPYVRAHFTGHMRVDSELLLIYYACRLQCIASHLLCVLTAVHHVNTMRVAAVHCSWATSLIGMSTPQLFLSSVRALVVFDV
jgi:hypothetical protein